MATKICCNCKEIKTLASFNKDINKSLGVSSQCRVCKKKYDRLRPKRPYKSRILTPEQRAHKLIKQKERRERIKLLSGNKPKRIILNTEEERKQRRTVMMRSWRKKYRAENPADKLANRLRQRIKSVLKDNMPQNKKTDTRAYYSKNAGCKGIELVKYLESLWKPGMTWDNYGWGTGKWNIDHIRPIADFIKCGEDPRKANHYSNLQPLWFDDNMQKGAKYTTSSKPTPNPSPNSTSEYEPESEYEGDTNTVLKGGQ